MDSLQALRICLQREHLRRTGAITFIVGTWLTFFNHGDILVTGNLSMWLIPKIFLNYLTPFVVSNLGVISRVQTSIDE